MAHLTEDTINDRIAEYLRSKGIKIITQVKGVGKGSNKPDFQIMEPKTIFGEGEWETSKYNGFRQMTDYMNLPGAEGAFFIIYPKELKSREMTLDVKEFFKDIKFHGLFHVKGYPSNPFLGSIDDLLEWISLSLDGKKRPDKLAQIETIRALVDGLTERLPKYVGKTFLFQHVAQFLPNPNEALKMTNRAAAYLLVNQVVFYRILSSKLVLDPIRSSEIDSPSDLYELYFKEVMKNIDYEAVFGIDLSSQVPKRSLQYIKDLIDFVDGMRPEAFSSDFLGSMFHNVIPLVVRKPLATYYTNPVAAALLAALTIEKSNDSVADFACGSGTLLIAAYDRKAKLLNKKITQKDHEKFIGKQLTGIDVMAFAAHLAAVQLALKQPTYLSNFVRIGVEDSLPLYPNFIIEPLNKTVSEEQSEISHSQTIGAKGAISKRGAGTKFELSKVNVILMNPPFTRKQRISKQYRANLREWLSSYTDFIFDSYSLWAYFILLTDKFILNKGKIGFVLPISILKQNTYSDLRRFLCKNFQLNYIIVGGHKSAFSENTAFRECLLVLEKRKMSDRKNKAHFVFLKEELTLTNIDILVKAIKADRNSEYADVNCISQTELNEINDWWSFIPEPKFSNEFTFKENKTSTFLTVLGSTGALKQGLRFHRSSSYMSPENSIISHSRDNVSIQYKIIDDKRNSIQFINGIGTTFQISKDSLSPALRTLSHQKKLLMKSPPDWLVINRFKNDDKFWQTQNVANILSKRRNQLNSRVGNIIMGGYGNYNLAAPGSCLIALLTDKPTAPTWTCWRMNIENKDDAKIITLYLNSTFALANLIDKSTEVEGSTRKWRKSTLFSMPIIDPKKLSEVERNILLKLFDSIANQELPSLLEQLKYGNEIRNKIDKTIMKIVIENGIENPEQIKELQEKIAEKIISWKRMMEEK